RLRDRARRRLPRAAGRRQPGHRPGPRPGRAGPRRAPAAPLTPASLCRVGRYHGAIMSSGSERTRVRIRFSKLGKVRFTSHRDTARIWERALRRADLPVAYTEGFAPRPRVSFGLALPTGAESLGEYLDVDL